MTLAALIYVLYNNTIIRSANLHDVHYEWTAEFTVQEPVNLVNLDGQT